MVLQLKYFEYALWRQNSEREFRDVLTSEVFWQLFSPPEPWIFDAEESISNQISTIEINTDIARRQNFISAIIKEIQDLVLFWTYTELNISTVVPDTNVVLYHFQRFSLIDWYRNSNSPFDGPIIICLPITVIDELDKLKRSDRTDSQGKSIRLLAQSSISTLSQNFLPVEKFLFLELKIVIMQHYWVQFLQVGRPFTGAPLMRKY